METQRILMRSLAVVFIASVIWTITVSADADQKVRSTCCTAVHTAEFTDPIIGVRMQKRSPPCVMAVIIKTERGDFCCDPSQPWVQRKVMQFIRAQKNKRLNSTPPPPSSISEHTVTAHLVQKVSTCCTVVSTAELTDPIIGVRMQKRSLLCVMAVTLQTERGEFCCDPSQQWVQKKVKQFIAQKNKRLNSTPPPASSISEHTVTAHPVQKVSTCCTVVSTAEFTDPVIGVRMQKRSLPCVMAVIFKTERGEFCCDPRQPWVQKKVKQFIAQKNKRLNSTPPPASSISEHTGFIHPHIYRWRAPSTGSAQADQKVSTCCTSVSTAEFTDPIIGVRLQKRSPPCVMAVIFETERGDLCYDPSQRWVQKKVKQFIRAQNNKLTSTP